MAAHIFNVFRTFFRACLIEHEFIIFTGHSVITLSGLGLLLFVMYSTQIVPTLQFQDIIQLINGDAAHWLVGISDVPKTFGLELLDTVLTDFAPVFFKVNVKSVYCHKRYKVTFKLTK